MNREEEVERLKAELAEAVKAIEENARVMEQFQSLHPNDGKNKAITSSIRRKLKEVEALRASLKENDKLLSERDEQVIVTLYIICMIEKNDVFIYFL